jgi:Monooxygenase af470-like
MLLRDRNSGALEPRLDTSRERRGWRRSLRGERSVLSRRVSSSSRSSVGTRPSGDEGEADHTDEGAEARVHPGRYSADIDGEFVVFLIGMRVNRPLRLRQWLPVAAAMPPMLRILDRHPELGCLGYQSWFGRTTILLQYWRDFESLDRFARDKQLPHLEPWRRFNIAVGKSGDVGIWHETYRVRAGDYEAIYANMPIFGLAAAGRHVPVSRKAHTAGARIGLSRVDQPAVTTY